MKKCATFTKSMGRWEAVKSKHESATRLDAQRFRGRGAAYSLRSWSTIWGAHREITVAFFRKITVLSNSWRCSEVGTVLPLRCSNQNAKSLTHNVKSVLAASCNRRWVSNVPYIRRKRTFDCIGTHNVYFYCAAQALYLWR